MKRAIKSLINRLTQERGKALRSGHYARAVRLKRRAAAIRGLSK